VKLRSWSDLATIYTSRSKLFASNSCSRAQRCRHLHFS